MKKRRIFVAVPISKMLQEEILDWEKKFLNLPVRWLPGAYFHITLIPPWYEKDVEPVIFLLNGLQKPAIVFFRFQFTKVAFGPDPRRPRLIWAEGEAPAGIRNLKLEIERVLNRKPEARPFRLHLTLARFRPETFSSFPIKKLDEAVSWQGEATSFALMESHLSRSGANYEVLAEFCIIHDDIVDIKRG